MSIIKILHTNQVTFQSKNFDFRANQEDCSDLQDFLEVYQVVECSGELQAVKDNIFIYIAGRIDLQIIQECALTATLLNVNKKININRKYRYNFNYFTSKNQKIIDIPYNYSADDEEDELVDNCIDIRHLIFEECYLAVDHFLNSESYKQL